MLWTNTLSVRVRNSLGKHTRHIWLLLRKLHFRPAGHAYCNTRHRLHIQLLERIVHMLEQYWHMQCINAGVVSFGNSKLRACMLRPNTILIWPWIPISKHG
jgi:hypothetical protein